MPPPDIAFEVEPSDVDIARQQRREQQNNAGTAPVPGVEITRGGKSEAELERDAINSLYEDFPSPEQINKILQGFFHNPNIRYGGGYGIYPGSNGDAANQDKTPDQSQNQDQGQDQAQDQAQTQAQNQEQEPNQEQNQEPGRNQEPVPNHQNQPETTAPAGNKQKPAAGAGRAVGSAAAPKEADSEIDYVRSRFLELDADHDEYITGKEVDQYLKDHKDLSQPERQALENFKSNISKLEELHNDEWFDENSGVTRADLNEAETRMKGLELAEKDFDKIDKDGNGFLSKDELAAYKQAPAYLKDSVSDLEEHSNDERFDENDGITRKDVTEARKDFGISSFHTHSPNTPGLPGAEPYKAPAKVRDGRVSKEDFADEATKMFDTLDTDKNGFLNEKELAAAVESDQYNGKQAQIVAALYRGQHGLEELSNDEWLDENDGVTRKDLAEFKKLQEADTKDREKPLKARAWLESDDRFKKLDTDGDEYLSMKEIDAALAAKDLSETDRTNLEFLKVNYSKLEDAHDDELGWENNGITMEDLDYYGDNTVAKVTSALFRTWEAQSAGNRELYGGKGNPLDAIKPDAVKQGIIGNCYFESAVASLAATNPQAIADMIKDNGDGTFTVTFPGAADEPITVDRPTEAEMGLYNEGGNNGVWANVLEKAYGKYRQSSIFRRSIMNPFGGDTTSEGSEGGEILLGNAMTLLTGKGKDFDYILFASDASLKEKLTAALCGDEKRPVIAGINGSIFDDETDDGFPNQHAYSVIGYDPDGPDGGTLTIRNPWGGGENSPRGTTKVSLKDFRQNFNEIVFSE